MEIIKTNNNRIEAEIISKAVDVLKAGGVAVLPTDTAYALCADATNKKAVEKVFDIKGREKTKAIYVFVSGLGMASNYGAFSNKAKEMVAKYWPGQLTIIVKKKNGSLDAITPNTKTIGLRMPKSELIKEITQKLGKPITGTSANIAGETPAYNIDEFLKQTEKQKSLLPNLILNAGPLPKRPVSTIIDLSRRKIKILRQGVVKI